MTLRDNSRDEVRYFVKGKARRIVVSSVLVAGLAIGGASYVLRQVQANLGGNPPQSATARKSTMTAPSGPRLATVAAASAQSGSFTGPVVNVYYGNVQVEIVRPLAEQTNEIYLQHTPELPQLANIHRRAADGYYGWPRYAPFDRIIVTTGIDHIPPILLQELKPGGIMVIPVGPPTGQVVLKITKSVGPDGNIHITREDIYHGTRKEIFVPFTAASGGTHNIGNTAN